VRGEAAGRLADRRADLLYSETPTTLENTPRRGGKMDKLPIEF
jgi:hypothetical protein